MTLKCCFSWLTFLSFTSQIHIQEWSTSLYKYIYKSDQLLFTNTYTRVINFFLQIHIQEWSTSFYKYIYKSDQLLFTISEHFVQLYLGRNELLFWWNDDDACFIYCSQTLKLFGFPIFRYWVYLMKVIPETCVHTKFDIYILLH